MAGPSAQSRADQIGALAAVLRELGVPVTALSTVLAHAAAVGAEAKRLGLIAPHDVDAVISRHAADSMLFALARAPQPGERWVDVGTGAGFPGMPLAACYPETEFVLVEPLRKRAGFLDLQVTRLGLDNVEVVGDRAESVEPGFDVATARALAEPSFALEVLLRLVEPSGTAIVAVGSRSTATFGAIEYEVARRGVDSPGRLFMISHTRGGA